MSKVKHLEAAAAGVGPTSYVELAHLHVRAGRGVRLPRRPPLLTRSDARASSLGGKDSPHPGGCPLPCPCNRSGAFALAGWCSEQGFNPKVAKPHGTAAEHYAHRSQRLSADLLQGELHLSGRGETVTVGWGACLDEKFCKGRAEVRAKYSRVDHRFVEHGP
jgi:hypothetical protein